jgi:four helix bundle protein
MSTQTYRDLSVWQKSMDLVIATYQLAQRFPPEERFGLTSQMQRAVVSIPANIAEGYGRVSGGDYNRFLMIARGSLMEVETHLQIAIRLNYLDQEKFTTIWSQIQEIGRMLHGLIRAVQRTNQT